MKSVILIAAPLLVSWAGSCIAENEAKPPFQFSSHGISVLMYQGRKITVTSGKPIKLHKPITVTCIGPADCMIKVEATVAADKPVRICTDVDGHPARPDFCSFFESDIGHYLASRVVTAGAHVLKTKTAVGSTAGGQIAGWGVIYTLYDPNVTQ